MRECFRNMLLSVGAVIGLWAMEGGLLSAEEDQAKAVPRGADEKASYAAPGPFGVGSFLADWHDPARNRTVPVKLYYPTQQGKSEDTPTRPAQLEDSVGQQGRPEDSAAHQAQPKDSAVQQAQPAAGLLPVILFSHGLGGSREGYSYLGQHWASHGYVCVHLQHPGSDSSVWRGQAEPLKALKEAVRTPRLAMDRSADVRFVLDRLEKLQTEQGPLKGRLDLKRIGMAGHSFGAHTTLVVAGQVAVLPGGREISQADPRIKVAVIMSPPVPQRPAQREKAYQKIAIPCFYMTGTEDDSPIGETRKEDRRLPFDLSGEAADRYLVIFTGGDHMIFSGRTPGLAGLPGTGSRGLVALRRQREKDAVFHRLICAGSTAFWDAYLRGDQKAKQWLAEGGFQKLLGSEGSFEKKLAKPSQPSSSSGGG